MSPSKSRAESEISQFYMALLVNENVVRLDVTMNEPQRMDVLERAGQFSSVESEIFELETWILKIGYFARSSLKMPILIRSCIRSPPGTYSIMK